MLWCDLVFENNIQNIEGAGKFPSENFKQLNAVWRNFPPQSVAKRIRAYESGECAIEMHDHHILTVFVQKQQRSSYHLPNGTQASRINMFTES